MKCIRYLIFAIRCIMYEKLNTLKTLTHITTMKAKSNKKKKQRQNFIPCLGSMFIVVKEYHHDTTHFLCLSFSLLYISGTKLMNDK